MRAPRDRRDGVPCRRIDSTDDRHPVVLAQYWRPTDYPLHVVLRSRDLLQCIRLVGERTGPGRLVSVVVLAGVVVLRAHPADTILSASATTAVGVYGPSDPEEHVGVDRVVQRGDGVEWEEGVGVPPCGSAALPGHPRGERKSNGDPIDVEPMFERQCLEQSEEEESIAYDSLQKECWILLFTTANRLAGETSSLVLVFDVEFALGSSL